MDASYREPVSGATPIGYSVLSGYDPDQIYINGAEAHPLATWTSYSLPAGASYKDALIKLQEANKRPWGLLRARLHFSDGQLEMFERKLPNVPGSFSNVRTYDPNGVYHQLTGEKAAVSRTQLEARLKFVSDDKGHTLFPERPRPRTFAPQQLFKNCPPPVHSQCGYDFTPISHASFLLKPSDHPKGVRKVQSNFEQKPCDYRPRSYLRDGPVDSRHCHCAEVYQVGDYTQDLARQTDVVDHRNQLVHKKYTHLGSYIPNSTIVGKRNARDPRFPCASKQKSASSLPPVVPQQTTDCNRDYYAGDRYASGDDCQEAAGYDGTSENVAMYKVAPLCLSLSLSRRSIKRRPYCAGPYANREHHLHHAHLLQKKRHGGKRINNNNNKQTNEEMTWPPAASLRPLTAPPQSGDDENFDVKKKKYRQKEVENFQIFQLTSQAFFPLCFFIPPFHQWELWKKKKKKKKKKGRRYQEKTASRATRSLPGQRCVMLCPPPPFTSPFRVVCFLLSACVCAGPILLLFATLLAASQFPLPTGYAAIVKTIFFTLVNLFFRLPEQHQHQENIRTKQLGETKKEKDKKKRKLSPPIPHLPYPRIPSTPSTPLEQTTYSGALSGVESDRGKSGTIRTRLIRRKCSRSKGCAQDNSLSLVDVQQQQGARVPSSLPPCYPTNRKKKNRSAFTFPTSPYIRVPLPNSSICTSDRLHFLFTKHLALGASFGLFSFDYFSRHADRLVTFILVLSRYCFIWDSAVLSLSLSLEYLWCPSTKENKTQEVVKLSLPEPRRRIHKTTQTKKKKKRIHFCFYFTQGPLFVSPAPPHTYFVSWIQTASRTTQTHPLLC
eukprot:gene1142-671_t